MLPNKTIGDDYKETYKRQHHSKFLSNDPDVKGRFNKFKVAPVFKVEDRKHFTNLYSYNENLLDQFQLPDDKKDAKNNTKKENAKKRDVSKSQKLENQKKGEFNNTTELKKDETATKINQSQTMNTTKEVEKIIKNTNDKDGNVMEKNESLLEQVDLHNQINDKLEKNPNLVNEDDNLKNLKEIFKKVFDPNNRREEGGGKKNEEELYIKKGSKTAKTIEEIDNGEKAVQFFAMYGNTTPIKFIFCKKKSMGNTFNFRPYDLEVIESDKLSDDFFIITPTGITHVYRSETQAEPGEKSMKEKNLDKVAEFYTLSDWMYQSTLFNILKRINYFKNYLPFKLLTIWRNYNRFKKFLRTRQNLSNRLFITKPAYVNSLIRSNGQIFQMLKVPLHDIIHQTWSTKNLIDFDDFHKPLLETAKNSIKKMLEVDIFETLKFLYTNISNRLKENREIDENENSKTLQEVKNKSMFKLKIEKKMRKKLIQMAKHDVDSFDRFINLIDLMCVEVLFQLNKRNMKDIRNEIYKPRPETNNTGIFTLTVSFGGGEVLMLPNDKDIEDHFKTLFKLMIDAIIEAPRYVAIFQKKDFESIFALESISNVNLNNNNPGGNNMDNDRSFSKPFDVFEEKIKQNFKTMIESAKYYGIFTGEINKKIKSSFLTALDLVKERFNSHSYSILQKESETLNYDEYIKGRPKIETSIKDKIEGLKRWFGKVEDLQSTFTAAHIMNIDLQHVKDSLKSYIQMSREHLDKYVKEKFDSVIRKISEDVKSYEKIKLTRKNNITAACEYKQSLNKYQSTLKKLSNRVDKLNLIVHLAKSNKIETISQLNISDSDQYKNAFQETDTKVRAGYEEINKLNDYYTNILEGEVKGNKEKIKELFEEITSGIYLEVDSARDLVRDSLLNMNQNITNCETKSKENNRHKNILENNPPDQGYKDNELEKLKNAFDLRNRLWSNLMNLDEDTVEWKKLTINQMRKTKIEDKIREYKTIGLDLNQRLSERAADKVCELFLEKTRVMDLSAPIIIALSSPSMLDIHWKEIFGYLKLQYNPDRSLDEITLGDLIDKHNITTYADTLDVISAAAISQEKIHKDLQKIQDDWSATKFNVIPHNKSKDKFIITALDDIMQLLEEHSQLVQSALNSRHVSVIRDQVQKWDDDLNNVNRVIEEWLMVQKQWIYLENIFSAEDIKKQLPDAHKNFTKVNKGFKDLMHKTHTNPNVIEICCQEGLLDMLVRFNKELDNIQKSLEDYLQTKRKAFPRFYFLSNDELLKILSQTRNPRAVQDYLSKCFDGIKTINFTSPTSNEIIQMVSPENEIVALSKSLTAHEVIEAWLAELETIMFVSVYDFCEQSLKDHPEYGVSRKDWIYSGLPCQGVITVDQIMWANNVEENFENYANGETNAIRDYSKFLETSIYELAEMVRDKVDELKKSLVERLIIINVHARDVVKDLIRENVTEKNNFEWQKNLKFYWEFDSESRRDEVTIRQTNSRFVLGYEYLGNPERMVITPLTDKCYITLTSALHLMYGGAPAGPAGTGKTETTKDLSKALAIKVNVFNCSDQLDFKTMGRMFCGLAECGAWACFDEFNRIDLEVLSVIAAQIETIQAALKEKKREMMFEGNLIGLKNGFGVFITMNPGYAGRSELPDNLKSLFRPVAMMIPDYALVSEVTLLSKGFKEARELSVKMYQLFKLSSEQLSKQKHYDFGLRGIKSILTRAGYLKEKFSNEPEKIVLIRAMKDSNLPKFLDNDIELFSDIIRDLFPRVEVEKVENKILLTKIKEILAKERMVAIPRFIEKINQLLDTMMVRLGNMIVGSAGCGKSALYSTLSKTLTELGKNKELPPDNWNCPIITSILNPKSVTKNELYMSKDEITQTWEDGIVAKLMRMAEDEEKEEKTLKRRWVVFDGPVDALWIEDMNTVLDDSRKLCLPDSSNIKIPKMMSLIFEVQDLQAASPATVSRCGMVYLETYHVGYMPVVENWHLTYKAKLNKIFEDDGSRKQKTLSDSVDRYLKLFDKTCDNIKTNVPKLIKYVRENCKEKIPTVDVNLVSSLLNLISCFFNPETIKLSADNLEEQFSYYLSFCLIWSIGGNIEDSSRNSFTKIMKEVMTKLGVSFDFSHDIYDLYVNEGSNFSRWIERKENFKFDKEQSFFSILVPTQDTIKYKYLMEHLSKNNFNSLFMGETGVGKSVIIMDYLIKLDNSSFLFKSSNFSAKTTSKNVYDTLKSSIFKNGNFQPPSGKKFIYFIDDINLPQLDLYGSQQPIEFIRQLIDLKTFYDDKKMQKKIKDVIFLSACAPPSGGRNKVTPRLFRHFNMIWMTELSIESMKIIFKSVLDGFLELGINKSLLDDSEDIIDGALELYNKIRTEKLPTPSKSHYTFNLRDLSKVIQGMLQVNTDYLTERPLLINLWIHETSRQFRDRLIGDDMDWFDREISYLHDQKFRLGEPTFTIESLIFTNVVDRNYKQIVDFQFLTKRVNEAMDKYNLSQRSGAMNLVFFNDAIFHFCRITRILYQDRGNALLVGLGGSGRQSLTKLVGSNLGFQINQLQIGKGYGVDLFWKDIGRILMKAGTSDSTQIFIFSDTQIIYESFLEDINNILNNGEVPNLYKDDELTAIFNSLKDAYRAENPNNSESKDGVYQYFVQNVRKRLRIVLCFSPVGEGFRNRCRQFPSIINCCTIDWFNLWPEDALISVADRFLGTLNEKPKEVRDPKEPVINTALSEDMSHKLQKIFVKVHAKAVTLAARFYEELRRSYYITPTSYLEYIKLFLDIYHEKIQIIPKQIANYKLGIQKLEEANVIVKNLEIELVELGPMQVKKKAEVEDLIVDLDKNTKLVEIEKQKIQGDKDAVEIKRNEILKVKEECDADLSKAKPDLDNAKVALGKLNEDDFRILKSFNKPSNNLLLLSKNVNFIFGTKNNEWQDFKNLIGEKDFLDNCKKEDYMISKLSDARKLKELAKLYSEIEPIDYKAVSAVAVNLKIWVGALLKYIECYRFVKPKMESLDAATKELAVVEADLFEKSKTLNAKLDELKKLQNSFEDAKNQLQELSDSIENISVKQKRAVRLVDGLKSEGIRWKENIQKLEVEEKSLIANVVISASIVSYSGPFTIEYREEFSKAVIDYIKEVGINYNPTEKFSLQEMLSDPLSIREWNYAGLPADDLSIDNAIVTVRSKRWPLIIDPQMQANKWIKNYYKNSGIRIYKMTDKTLFNRLKDCISGGYPVLVENVEQTIESSMEPILQKQVWKQGAIHLIAMGGNEKPIQFSNQFKLFMTSKLANPHYLPEISIKVTLINFTVTLKGLEDQLLVDVVKHERPDLESQRDSLILNINENKKAIKDLEYQILNMVKDASTEILDNDILVNKLDQSKEQSTIISADLEKAEKTATTINKERRGYRPIAVRGSILYFVISSLANIDSMYNYSLEYFAKIFNQRLERSERSDIVSKRIEILITDITISFYEKISRGLFEKDKLLYSFLILSNLLMNDKQISILEWSFFLKGTGLPKCEKTEEEFVNKYSQYFHDYNNYRSLVSMKDLSMKFKNIEEDLSKMDENELKMIKEFMTSETPYGVKLPEAIEKHLTDFFRLCLVKILREEKLIFAIKSFIEKSMGKRYVESPPFSIGGAFDDSLKTTPLIFILSPGANPVNFLRLYSKEKKIPMMNISLGQGQGIIAKNAILRAKDKGEWVCLENCHLSKSWMPALEELLEEVNEDEEFIEDNYRLWLTSMPTPFFPVSILQNGVKITNEPPKGLKANLKGTYNNIKEEDFNNSSKPIELQKITFCLAFFHAIILERRKYGPLGWNIPYEWMNSDFEASKLHVKMYIEEYEEVPYQILQFLIGVINYGGRVTDDKDCKLISAILNKYVNDLVIDDLYKFDENGKYYAPNMEGDVPTCLNRVSEYLETLPLDDSPDVFGLNYNANITLQNKMVREFMEPLIAIQPRSSSSAAKKPDDIVLELRDQLFVQFAKINKLDTSKGSEESIYEGGDKNNKKSPLGNFLIQECDKFNNLIGIIKNSLTNLEKAVKGTIVMSPDIENIYNAFLLSHVPKLWEDNAYLSLKPLASWMSDFVERCLFMEKWLYEGKRYYYWLSAFFFPQGFNTAVLQTYARKTSEAIDSLTFKTVILNKHKEDITEHPENGLYINGLFLQGASWDWEEGRIIESTKGELWHEMPCIWLEPCKTSQLKKMGFYECPLYKTSRRAGELSTTGHSTNFVMYFYLKCEEDSDHWIRRGTALLTQLDN